MGAPCGYYLLVFKLRENPYLSALHTQTLDRKFAVTGDCLDRTRRGARKHPGGEEEAQGSFRAEGAPGAA